MFSNKTIRGAKTKPAPKVTQLKVLKDFINDFMAKKICRELEITEPGKQKKSDQGEQSDAADSH